MNIYSQISSNKTKTIGIITVFIIIISLFFYLAGLYFGDVQFYAILGLVVSGFSGFYSYFYSDKLVLAMAHAKPALKKDYFDFYTVTENLCIASGIPMPKLYVIQDEAPNAFATGRNPENAVVAATTGLLAKLDRAEIEGVIAHELSHIRNYDILVMTVVTVLVGTIAFAVDMMTRSLWFGGRDSDSRDSKLGGIGIILFFVSLLILPLLASLIQMAVSRKREYLADASGALVTRNPDGLARALEKIAAYTGTMKTASTATAHMYISNPFKKGTKTSSWISTLFSTHPPVAERIRILRGM